MRRPPPAPRGNFLRWLLLALVAWPATFLTQTPPTRAHALSTTHRSEPDAAPFPVVVSSALSSPPSPAPEGTLLVSTLDGRLHALDLKSGEYLWSFGAGSSLLHSSFEKEAKEARAKGRSERAAEDEDEDAGEEAVGDAKPIADNVRAALRTPHEQLEADLHRDLASGDLIFDQDEEEHTGHPHAQQQRERRGGRRTRGPAQNGSSSPLMIPGVDGSLFYSGTHGLQRLPINVAELVEAAPFKTGDNTRYLGFKETNVFLIHRNTGALKRVFSPMHTHAFSLNEECDVGGVGDDKDGCDPNLIWVAKTDLTVHAIDGRSRKLRWNVSISTYAPFDNTEQVAEWTDAELTTKGYPEIGVSVGGTVHAIDILNQRVIWTQPLQSPVTSVFLVRPEEAASVDPSDGDAPPHLNSGDMIKLPHFYFDLDPEIPSSGSANQDTLNAIVAHYHQARDLSQVTQFTYIGQTRQGLIYALPNPQPLSDSPAYAVDGFVSKGGGIRQWTAKDRPAISSSQPGAGGGGSATSLSSIVLSHAKSTAGKISYVAKKDGQAPDAAVEESISETDCLPTSNSYPRCLIGFHPIDLLSGSESAPSSTLTTGASGRGGDQKLLDVSREFFNQSVKPSHPTKGDRARDKDGDEEGAGRTIVVRDRRPIRRNEDQDDSDDDDDDDDSLIGDHRHGGVKLPRDTGRRDLRPRAPQLLLPSPALSFHDFAFWWPVLAISIIVSVVISSTMWMLQRLGRRRGGGGGASSGSGSSNAGGKTKGKGKNKNANNKNTAAIEPTAEEETTGSPDSAGDEKEDGSPSEKGNALTVAQKRRNKKELLRGTFVRQTSEPSPPVSTALSVSPSPGVSASPSTSGSLVQRKSHFSTYDLDSPSLSNLAAPAMLFHATGAAGGAGGTNSNSAHSGESKAIRPRKHIQSKPDTMKMNLDAASSSQSPTLNKVFSQAQSNPDGSVTIGSMVLYPHQVLGTGSMGTVVYAGTFGGRPCAIKRLVKPFFGSANAAQEIALLIQSDQHPNVLRYYAKDEDTSFIYLALELCAGTIQDLIQDDAESRWPQDQVKAILFGMMTGLAHLHALHIVHRDLKPMNILLTKQGGVRVSDMGLGKQLSMSRSSFDSVVSGSIGWQAPEVLNANGGRLTKAVDVFSAGCVLHFVLTHGRHPFGENVERELNIVNNRMDLSALGDHPEARDLIGNMLQPNPALRMSAEDVVAHPFFWSPAKQLSFLLEASDRFESEPEHGEARMCLESQASEVVGDNWHMHLNQGLLDNLLKYRKYDYSSVRDLLRVIRNKKNHYRDLPADVRAEVGPIPDGFLRYFTSRFPALLIYIYSVLSCFCLESPASSVGDQYSYSPLDLDHAHSSAYESDLRLESASQFYHKSLAQYPELKFSSPQFEQFYADISLKRLVLLQRHTRLRFRHWHIPEEAWIRAGTNQADGRAEEGDVTTPQQEEKKSK